MSAQIRLPTKYNVPINVNKKFQRDIKNKSRIQKGDFLGTAQAASIRR